MGISFPWDDGCSDSMEVDDKTYRLIQGPVPVDNVLWGLYASWTCVYQAADGSVHMETRRRALWIFDF